MAKKEDSISDVRNELRDIKKLLMLKLINDGITQSQIAAALGIDPGNLSRMLPARLAKAKKKAKG